MRKTLLAVFAASLLTCLLPSRAMAHPCPSDDGKAAAEGDAAAVDCPDPSETSTVCIGDQLCHGHVSGYFYPEDGKCPEGSTLVKIGSVTKACEASKNVTPDPGPCSQLCQNLGTTSSSTRNSRCCTTTVTRTCSPFPS
jgi:hypothetical protein